MCRACFSPSLSLYLSRYLSISFSLSHSAVRCLWEIVGKMQLVWWLHKNSNWIRRKRKRKCCVIPHISPMPHWEKLIANFWQVFLVSFHFVTVVFLSVYSHVYTVLQFPLYARTPNSLPPPPPQLKLMGAATVARWAGIIKHSNSRVSKLSRSEDEFNCKFAQAVCITWQTRWRCASCSICYCTANCM